MSDLKYLRVSVCEECNMNCWYCFNEGLESGNCYLNDVDGFKWLMNKITQLYNIEIIRFTGGEPLLNKKLPDLISSVKPLGIKRIGLTTNGILLPYAIEDIRESGVTHFAVHLCQIDMEPVSMEDIFKFINSITKLIDDVRFNIVVTKKNEKYIEPILVYAINHGINLLILDLLKAKCTMETFLNNYVSLDKYRDILRKRRIPEFAEAVNSTSFKYGKSTIKFVSHYQSSRNLCAYCTNQMDYHPILLSSDFKLHICTQFGTTTESLWSEVCARDVESLKRKIDSAIYKLHNCSQCSNRILIR